MRAEFWGVKRIQRVALTSSFSWRWVLLTCSKCFRLSHHLFSVLSGTCEPLACSCRNRQSFMNKRQGLTTLKETKQRETLDQRGLAQFQGQTQRQMLVLFQNKKSKIPSFTGRALFISPPCQVVFECWRHQTLSFSIKIPGAFYDHAALASEWFVFLSLCLQSIFKTTLPCSECWAWLSKLQLNQKHSWWFGQIQAGWDSCQRYICFCLLKEQSWEMCTAIRKSLTKACAFRKSFFRKFIFESASFVSYSRPWCADQMQSAIMSWKAMPCFCPLQNCKIECKG